MILPVIPRRKPRKKYKPTSLDHQHHENHENRIKGMNEINQERLVAQKIKENHLLGKIMTKNNPKARITLISFPYEDGNQRDEFYRKEGSEFGGDSLRRFLPLSGTLKHPQMSESQRAKFGSLEISDLGHIKFRDKTRRNKFKLSKNTVSLEENLEALRMKLYPRFQDEGWQERVSLGVSASRETVYSFLKAYLISDPEKPFEIARKLKLIVLSNSLDLRDLYNGSNIHAGCGVRKFLQEYPAAEGHLKIEYYGVVRERVFPEEEEFIAKHEEVFSKIVYSDQLEKDTWGQLEESVAQFEGQIGLSLNLEAIKVSVFATRILSLVWNFGLNLCRLISLQGLVGPA